MLDVFTDPAVFTALHPVVQIFVVVLGCVLLAVAVLVAGWILGSLT
jgi:hypothetical protein